ncbi:MAG: hypothetical protein IT480_08070 [Gammaproteobacteria bacterium]|nr:hypothetical protein [Gammaproteobacteria bacterium]
MIPAGLSFEQAPPLTAPLRFFLTAPLYLVGAGALLWHAGPAALATRWAPATMALTHLLTLGFIAQVMLGATLQVLPVVAGAPVAHPRAIATVTHLGLNLGTLTLAAGFLLGAVPLLKLATVLLGIGLGTMVIAATVALARGRGAGSATLTGLRLAYGGLAITLVLGMLLVLALGGAPQLALLPLLAAHVIWGFLGWVLTLVAAVAYQVVPMFQVTPPYPAGAVRRLLPALFALLTLRSLATAGGLPAAIVAVLDSLLALLAIGFAGTTLRLQQRRRRRVADVTVRFWQLAMLCLIATALLAAASSGFTAPASDPRLPLAVGVLALFGFAVAVISGMLYKIVPFLIWFHAQARSAGRGTLRSTQDVMTTAAARWHLRLHALCLALLAGAVLWPAALARVAALLLMATGLWLARNLFSAARRVPAAPR